jgi:methyltransferase family protein
VPPLLRLIGRPVRAVLRTIGLDLVRYQVIRPGDLEQGQFAAPASLGRVRERFPFPAPPSGEAVLPPEPPNGRDLIEDLIRRRQVSVLLEIGSFLGGSTLRWLRASPDLAVVAVDPWQDGWAGDYLAGRGYPDQRDGLNAANGLFEMFLRNVLPFAGRVVPVRAASPMVLDELARLGLRVDLVFIDAAKLTGDLVTASELWPDAILTGDDWSFDGDDSTSPMRDVVLRFAQQRGLEVVRKSETWVITGAPETVTTLVP